MVSYWRNYYGGIKMSKINSDIEIIFSAVEAALPELYEIAKFLYENPEIGGEEEQASRLLVDSLENHGFNVTCNYFEIEHAFRAVYDSGKPGAKIGIFAEYDALPEIGHGCCHNLICTAALGAAYGLQTVLSDVGGKIIVFGTPGEENIQTKTVMAPLGAFDEADVAMMIHPHGISASSGRTRAIESLQIEFYGKTSHAGSAPELGINALDAAVLCYQMISQQKNYYPDTNVHGIINHGGSKASVIPDYASMKYLTRAWDMGTLKRLRTMVENCAEAAAKATGCKWKIFNNEQTNAAMNSNHTMSEIFDKYLIMAGETSIESVDHTGSTDMGDVSMILPSIHPFVGLGNADLVPHSREMADTTVTEDGRLCMERGAKALAGTAFEILKYEGLLKVIKKEFADSIGN